jgi:hypothetical protein
VGLLLRETAMRARRLPVWETLCCGALTLAAHGTEPQQELLRDVVSGSRILTPAVRDSSSTTSAGTTYAEGRVTGRKVAVTYAGQASHPSSAAPRSTSSPTSRTCWSPPAPVSPPAG